MVYTFFYSRVLAPSYSFLVVWVAQTLEVVVLIHSLILRITSGSVKTSPTKLRTAEAMTSLWGWKWRMFQVTMMSCRGLIQ